MKENTRLNSTIVGEQRLVYDRQPGVHGAKRDNFVFGGRRDAATLTCREFIDRLTELQRNALARRLRSDETSGATIAFSSMARWNVTRHIPVLPPQTALIVAHAAPSSDGRATLGATYDHRVLTGFEALSTLAEINRLEALV